MHAITPYSVQVNVLLKQWKHGVYIVVALPLISLRKYWPNCQSHGTVSCSEPHKRDSCLDNATYV